MAENATQSSGMKETQINDIQKLQREIRHLQQENKALHVRAQGVQVLGKVLQDSQEENIHLKAEIDGMKEKLKESGVGDTYLFPSRSDSKCSYSEYGSRYLGPQSNSSFFYHNLNVNPETGNMSGPSSGLTSIYNGDLHVKDVHTKLEHLKQEYEELTEQAKKLMDSVNEDVMPSEEPNAEVQVKLGHLCMRLETNRKEARTRETLARALAIEEHEMKERLQAMEAEQTSYETAIAQLERVMAEGKEELKHLRDETNTFKEALLVKQSRPSSANTQSSCIVAATSSSSSGGSFQGALIVKSPGDAVASGDCIHCGQLQRQNSELQRQLESVKNERDEAARQKEEILDVNHAWDAQYRKLQAEMMQKMNDLKQQNEILKGADQTRKFDKLWLSAKSMMDNEKQAKEQILKEKKILEEHVKALEEEKNAIILQVEHGQNHVSTLQQQLHLMSLSRGQEIPPQPGYEPHQSSGIRIPLVTPLPLPVPPAAAEAAAGTSVPLTEPSAPRPTPFGREPSPEMIDQIEALKQQLRVYADDFQSERSDRERMQSEKDQLKEQLDAMQQQVLVLEQQVHVYEEDFHKEKREKEELQSQMRAAQSGSKMHGGAYQPHVQDVSRRVQSVAEQQAKVNAIREVHEREQRRLLREQQELQQHAYTQQQQQPHTQRRYSPNYVPPYVPPSAGRYAFTNSSFAPQDSQAAYLRARGPIDESAIDRSNRPADEMFRGGEVFPDRGVEVEDGVSADKGGATEEKGELPKKECPRCLREFTEEEIMIKHIEKCIP